MSPTEPPAWIAGLDEDDLAFAKRFLLASGSMKEVACEYGVSYPTVRLRLDRLIQKIRLADQTGDDPYIDLIKRLAVDDKLSLDTARMLIDAYRRQHAQPPAPAQTPQS
ncbi:DUF2089 family protein [Bifidobacterium vespertilionis]|uniref:DUF2089 family protein n=1 Tax=Bifidobacterium vespertilionis TaxID=2562524 RepID=A0A5J5DYP8_9BIFI|nr:DUF2089 family protein [Bifidobacterium vespertilionis]KAA8821986.1 DUF2089 family protein [Bifidobacterium vespertilionis]KAA8823573.1 DUF2089 family protein [Bifidobacterium vespertilionis]